MAWTDYIFPPVLILFAVYIVALMIRMYRAPARDMISVGRENTEAVRENSELLRELIAINRQLLDSRSKDTP